MPAIPGQAKVVGSLLALPDPGRMFRLDGRGTLVTGASRGIGRAIALTLAGAGADVAVHFHANQAAADLVAGSIAASGRRAATPPVCGAMKAALAHLMHKPGKDQAGRGVTANTISPGLIETDRNAELPADPVAHAALLARIPVGRGGVPDEVAGLALLLASGLGAHVTGEEIFVDGGLGLP